MAAEQPALHFLYQEISGLSMNLDRDAVRRSLIAMRTTRPEEVAALPMPVLCITGEEDVVMPPAAVEVFASVIPGARLERVPHAGHSVYFERPDTFNRLVDEFLAGT
jgi:3-oxoadipate enol-lactonase